MIHFVTGDLFKSNAYALVNTLNTVGVMGKSVALQFKVEFSHNFNVYVHACKNQQLQIGKILPVTDRSLFLGEQLIINFPTKTHWRLPSEYSFIDKGLSALVKLIIQQKIKSIALPVLGCGNGGLEWIIVQMIFEYLENVDAKFEIYEPGVYFCFSAG